MALIIPGGALGGGVISGKQGSIVFSRNRFGAYVRNLVIPVNPNTAQQQAIRAALGTLTNRWNNVLTDAQRDAWESWAANVPITSKKLGTQINLTGLNAYLQRNVMAIQAGIAVQDNGPIVFSLATFTPVTVASDVVNQEVDVTFDNTDDWANESGGFMSVFISRPKSNTINFFDGPYRFGDSIDGDAVAPTSPAAIPAPFAFSSGARLFVRVRVARADGRISADQALTLDVP